MKLRDSLAENKSIRLQAEANTWQEAVKIAGSGRCGRAALLPGDSGWR